MFYPTYLDGEQVYPKMCMQDHPYFNLEGILFYLTLLEL